MTAARTDGRVGGATVSGLQSRGGGVISGPVMIPGVISGSRPGCRASLPALGAAGAGRRGVAGWGGAGSRGVAMSALRALRAALRVYAVGIWVMFTQLLRRLRGGFRPPGESRGVGAGSAWGRGAPPGVRRDPRAAKRQLAPPPAGNRKCACCEWAEAPGAVC